MLLGAPADLSGSKPDMGSYKQWHRPGNDKTVVYLLEARELWISCARWDGMLEMRDKEELREESKRWAGT